MVNDTVHPDRALQLHGRRVLVVEDEYYLADDIRRTLTAAGANIIGPFSTLREAQIAVDDRDFDCAVLDLNLHGESAAPIAEQLLDRGKRFVLATGYGSSAVPERLQDVPRVEKPFDPAALLNVVSQLGCTTPNRLR
jgi:DNA-binding NtrC family response regulator